MPPNLLLLTLLLLISVLTATQKKWTIFVYINADNNLDWFAQESLVRMRNISYDTSSYQFVVYLDRVGPDYGMWDHYYWNLPEIPNELRQLTGSAYLVPKQGKWDIFFGADGPWFSETDSDNRASLTDFLDWGIQNYPASNYMLHFWSHGGGFPFGVGGDENPWDEKKRSSDEDHQPPFLTFKRTPQPLTAPTRKVTERTTNQRNTMKSSFRTPKHLERKSLFNSRPTPSTLGIREVGWPEEANMKRRTRSPTDFKKPRDMSMIDIRDEIASFEDFYQIKLKVLGFDACLQGSYEVTRRLAQYTDFFLFSADLEPGRGWDYSSFRVLDDPDFSMELLGQTLFEDYLVWNSNSPDHTSDWQHELTLAFIDAAKIQELDYEWNRMLSLMDKYDSIYDWHSFEGICASESTRTLNYYISTNRVYWGSGRARLYHPGIDSQTHQLELTYYFSCLNDIVDFEWAKALAIVQESIVAGRGFSIWSPGRDAWCWDNGMMKELNPMYHNYLVQKGQPSCSRRKSDETPDFWVADQTFFEEKSQILNLPLTLETEGLLEKSYYLVGPLGDPETFWVFGDLPALHSYNEQKGYPTLQAPLNYLEITVMDDSMEEKMVYYSIEPGSEGEPSLYKFWFQVFRSQKDALAPDWNEKSSLVRWHALVTSDLRIVSDDYFVTNEDTGITVGYAPQKGTFWFPLYVDAKPLEGDYWGGWFFDVNSYLVWTETVDQQGGFNFNEYGYDNFYNKSTHILALMTVLHNGLTLYEAQYFDDQLQPIYSRTECHPDCDLVECDRDIWEWGKSNISNTLTQGNYDMSLCYGVDDVDKYQIFVGAGKKLEISLFFEEYVKVKVVLKSSDGTKLKKSKEKGTELSVKYKNSVDDEIGVEIKILTPTSKPTAHYRMKVSFKN